MHQEPIHSKQKTILIVDDDPIVRRLLSIVVEMAGYESMTAVNGSEALSTLQEHKIDLVLLDVMMPGGMNGFEVCQQIRRSLELQHIPIFLVTALGDKKHMEQGADAGANDFVTKPFSNDKLIKLINHSLSQVTDLQ